MPHSVPLLFPATTLPDDNQRLSCLLSDSWQRSQRYGLSRDDAAGAAVSAALLAEVRSDNYWLSQLARPLVDKLHQALRDQPAMIVLADDAGLVLETFGNHDFLCKAERLALSPGNLWGEHARGTNAIGTALALHTHCEVQGSEHFLNHNAGLYCYGAPLFRPDGQIAGVLDISSPAHHPLPQAGALIRQTLRQLEHHWVSHSLSTRQWLLALHREPDMLGTVSELLLVFRDNLLVGANRLAMEEFALSAGQMSNLTLEALFPDYQPGQRRGSLTDARARHYYLRHQPAARRQVAIKAPPVCCEESGVELEKALRLLNAGIALSITGETGCGKEHLSRRLHQQSRWRDGPFVAINCAALPENLIESELFGYLPGAFTGASSKGYTGKIREAQGGVLFLDEIGDMPLTLQTRLLRVLQEKQITPLGGTRPQAVEFTLICATHRHLDQLVAAGSFREDLLYRIQEFSLRIPPLREWPALPRFVRRLWRELGGEKRDVTLEPELVAYLARQPWPGNVRQLMSLLKVLLALADDGDVVTLADLPQPWHTQPASPPPFRERESAAAGTDLHATLRSVNGNMTLAARQLGISRSTLYRWLEKARA